MLSPDNNTLDKITYRFYLFVAGTFVYLWGWWFWHHRHNLGMLITVQCLLQEQHCLPIKIVSNFLYIRYIRNVPPIVQTIKTTRKVMKENKGDLYSLRSGWHMIDREYRSLNDDLIIIPPSPCPIHLVTIGSAGNTPGVGDRGDRHSLTLCFRVRCSSYTKSIVCQPLYRLRRMAQYLNSLIGGARKTSSLLLSLGTENAILSLCFRFWGNLGNA